MWAVILSGSTEFVSHIGTSRIWVWLWLGLGSMMGFVSFTVCLALGLWAWVCCGLVLLVHLEGCSGWLVAADLGFGVWALSEQGLHLGFRLWMRCAEVFSVKDQSSDCST